MPNLDNNLKAKKEAIQAKKKPKTAYNELISGVKGKGKITVPELWGGGFNPTAKPATVTKGGTVIKAKPKAPKKEIDPKRKAKRAERRKKMGGKAGDAKSAAISKRNDGKSKGGLGTSLMKGLNRVR